MGRKLYVGNLPFDTGDDELRLAFAQCGTVSEVKVIADRETGRSRGFGFVTMSTNDEAQAAIQRWEGSAFGGRQLKVNEAVDKPRDGRPSGGGQAPQQGGYSRGTYVADAPPPDRGGDRGRGRGGRDRGRGRGSDYG
jgi:RNA recognition motif-containing protein